MTEKLEGFRLHDFAFIDGENDKTWIITVMESLRTGNFVVINKNHPEGLQIFESLEEAVESISKDPRSIDHDQWHFTRIYQGLSRGLQIKEEPDEV